MSIKDKIDSVLNEVKDVDPKAKKLLNDMIKLHSNITKIRYKFGDVSKQALKLKGARAFSYNDTLSKMGDKIFTISDELRSWIGSLKG